MTPKRVFLDTNIYIIGASDPASAEGRILRWAGFDGLETDVEIVMSDEVLDQIRRVGRRVAGKDWAGDLLARLWRNLKLAYVKVTAEEVVELANAQPSIPREDLIVYLTARNGAAECFVSYNHELITTLASTHQEFESVKPEDFVRLYLPETGAA